VSRFFNKFEFFSFLDESTTPFNVFTNSFAIFTEFFRGFFSPTQRSSFDEEDEFYEENEEAKIPSSIEISEGSGINEIVASEGFLVKSHPLLNEDEDINHLIGVETRRKPRKKARKDFDVEYEIEASGHLG
jgi:hypothetical protein